MKDKANKIAFTCFWVMLMLCLITPKHSFALVFHPDHEPNMAEWSDVPSPNVVGKWITNLSSTNGRASCVAISPRFVITTKHQGGGTASIIEIGGQQYQIAEIWDHPDKPNPSFPDYKVVDLRLAKLVDADLQDFVPLYTRFNEAAGVSYAAFGGFGLGRGSSLYTDGLLYGYQWQDRNTYRNDTQRWGTNMVDATYNNYYFDESGILYNIDLIISDFDGHDPVIDDSETTIYETIFAEFDSGAGVFLKSDGQWHLAGIGRAVEHVGESWFRDEADPNIAHPDAFYSVRVSSYDGWIESVIDVMGDLTGDYRVNFHDFNIIAKNWQRDDCRFQNEWCDGADFPPHSGGVDIDDLEFFLDFWLAE